MIHFVRSFHEKFRSFLKMLFVQKLPGYQIKIKLICRLTKRADKALISISTIQEFQLDWIPDT